MSNLTRHFLLSRMIRTKAVSILRICHNACYNVNFKKLFELTSVSVSVQCQLALTEQQIKQLESEILFAILKKPRQRLILDTEKLRSQPT